MLFRGREPPLHGSKSLGVFYGCSINSPYTHASPCVYVRGSVICRLGLDALAVFLFAWRQARTCTAQRGSAQLWIVHECLGGALRCTGISPAFALFSRQ